MERFSGRLAVVTGGGSGMGRELVLQLAAEGCSVATCDLDLERAGDTAARALAGAPAGAMVTAHACDVSDEAQVERFRDELLRAHGRNTVELLFSNAGVGGGDSFVVGDRGSFDRTFAVCWGGVYACARAFLPTLIAADEAVLVHTSSVNAFWSWLGPGAPHVAYSAAKAAVRGFSEALIEDLRVHAPHVRVAVTFPGHVGTDILANSRAVLRGSTTEAAELAEGRASLAARGVRTEGMSDDEVREALERVSRRFRERAPTTAAQAATAILDGVRAGRWRILVGDDAVAVDEAVRAHPDEAYDHDGPVLRRLFGG